MSLLPFLLNIVIVVFVTYQVFKFQPQKLLCPIKWFLHVIAFIYYRLRLTLMDLPQEQLDEWLKRVVIPKDVKSRYSYVLALMMFGRLEILI